jgi:hypothetical protein
VIDAVHAAGGKMAPQIWHQGMSRKPGTGHFPDAPSDGPSGITLTGKKISDEPSEAEVIDMAQAYADAAADAKRLGFDCIELHGAHIGFMGQRGADGLQHHGEADPRRQRHARLDILRQPLLGQGHAIGGQQRLGAGLVERHGRQQLRR